MGWRESLQTASFRGVKFKVEGHDTTVGRRLAVHQYPERDLPFVEDMGRAARAWKIEAYLVGENYQVARDRLIRAIEEAGPGELVHPYLGRKVVFCEPAGLRETTSEGGYCRFSLSFIEAGEAAYPSANEDGDSALGIKADKAARKARDEFAADFDVDGQPAWSIASVTERIQALTSTLEGLGSKLLPAGELGGYFRDVRELADNVNTLVTTPDRLAAQLEQNVMVLGGVSDAGMSAVRDLLGLSTDDESGVPLTTSTRYTQRDNIRAFRRLIRALGISAGAKAARRVRFTAYEDAATLSTEITGAIDTESETASDQVYIALQELRAQVVTALPDAAELPRLMTVTPILTVPSLLLAHRLYGDATRADEIVARNRLRHPGFVSGGRAIQVLTDG